MRLVIGRTDWILLVGEEELLVRFFGDDYVEYRKKTRVGIPGIS